MLMFLFGGALMAQEMEETTLRKGMWVLNSWAIGNIATGVPLSLTLEDLQWSSFHQMNAGWNIINAGLATASLIRTKPIDARRLSNVFWVNAGLDVGYTSIGLWMVQRGKSTQNPQMIGWGNSVVLQGGFLFCFDVIMAAQMMRY